MSPAHDMMTKQGLTVVQSVGDLIDIVLRYNPQTNSALIREAYDFGEKMHEGQFRRSGEPYFTHPVAVGVILAEQQMDDATIITALEATNLQHI